MFASRGWTVVLAARSEERIQNIAEEIESSGGAALAVQTDVTEWSEVEALAERTVESFGRIDALVNNAGRGSFGTVASLDLDELESVFRLNVMAPVAAMKAVTPVMRRQGYGAIVNVSSQVENIAAPFLGSYAASKVALGYLSDAARIELDHAGISVTNVLPGLTDTGFGSNTARIGSLDDFTIDEALSSGPGGGAPPEAVAETVWRAVRDRPRKLDVGLGNRVGGGIARRSPGSVNALLKWSVNRYVPREGYTPASPKRDLLGLGVLASVPLVAAVVGAVAKHQGDR
jgi:short-subunit dehydrogenase